MLLRTNLERTLDLYTLQNDCQVLFSLFFGLTQIPKNIEIITFSVPTEIFYLTEVVAN